MTTSSDSAESWLKGAHYNMEKRKLQIGAYDTARDGLWTLSGLSLGRAEAAENYAIVPGHSGPLDLSTVLTDGEPYYGSRAFEAVLESSEGTRREREQRISQMVNALDGFRLNIVLPDDPDHYITGRVRVERLYNDLAHASVRVMATCDPWRYNAAETVVTRTAAEAEQAVQLLNAGRRSVVPSIKITDGDVRVIFSVGSEDRAWALVPGDYKIPDIYLKTGESTLQYSGAGKITLTYREAVL